MSLKNLVKKKDKHIAAMIASFEKEFDAMGNDVQRQIKRLFSNGVFDIAAIKQAFVASGYSDLVNAWVDNYSDVIAFNKQIADEIGVKFVLSNKAIDWFDLIQETDIEKLNILNDVYVADMKKMGTRYLLEGKRFSDVAFNTEISEIFTTFGRRLTTEAYTGIYIADSAIKKDFFEQARIELYYYDGPNDEVTRDECRATLGDPRQDTGWTIAEIGTSMTPFIERGGYNCRHEWLPLVK